MQDDIFHRAANSHGRPAVTVALFFISGILISSLFPRSELLFWLFLFLSVVALLSSLFACRTKWFGVCIAVTFVLLGYLRYSADSTRPNSILWSEIAEPSRNILAWGTVVDRPTIREDRARFIVRTDSLFDGTIKLRGRKDLLAIVSPDPRFDNGLMEIRYGEYVLVHGVIHIPVGRRNPYEPDFNRFLELNGIDALLYVRGYYNVESQGMGRANLFITEVVVPIRNYVSGIIDRNHAGEQAHFLRGLLLGDRSRISDDVRETFVVVGVIHVLAVSGLHVGIVTIILLSLFSLFRIPRTIRIFLTIGGLILYMFVTGAAPSVVRATVMASIILLGFLFQRKSDIYNSIAVAALVLLFFDTRELFKPSFQLSFAAVVSIVYFYPRFWQGIRTNVPAVESGWVVKYILQLFLVSCAAQIGTLPFTAYYYERISVAAFAANLFVIPGVFLVLSFGFTSAIFGLVSRTLEIIYGTVTEVLLTGILQFVGYMSRLSYASFEVHHFGILNGLIFYAVIAIIFHLNDPVRFRKAVIAFLGMLNIFMLHYNLTFDPTSRQPKLRITMLDVGQGTAILIEFPDGQTMLYDGGPRTLVSDAGETIVVPFLKRHGIRYLDSVVISHPHADHYGGLPAVLREITVGTIYDTGQPASGAWLNELHSEIERQGIPVHFVQAGDKFKEFENVRVYVLHPAPVFIQDLEDTRIWNLNNVSIVLLIVYGDVRILLTGDAEIEAEHYMLHFYGDFLRADILKAGHHGSSTSSTERFVSMVSPSHVLISVGRMNRFNHPGNDVIQRFNDHGVEIFRADYHGAVIVQSCGREYTVYTMR